MICNYIITLLKTSDPKFPDPSNPKMKISSPNFIIIRHCASNVRFDLHKRDRLN